MNNILTESEYQKVKDIVGKTYGLTLKTLARESLSARLFPRLAHLRMGSFGEYLEFLLSSPAATSEWQELPSLIMNTESYFFREPDQLTVFCRLFADVLTARKEPSPSVRIISAGCASGQEPYSIAISIKKECSVPKSVSLEIIGLDINTKALERARFGLYNSYSFRTVNPSDYDSFFTRVSSNMFRIAPGTAKMVSFVHRNILDPESIYGYRNADFIFCRNVLIYMTKEATGKIVKNLWDALADDGHLFISQSESIKQYRELFTPVKIGNVTVYRKNPRS